MARRTFDVIDVTEILMHWHAGRSKSEMAGEPGGGPQDAAQVHRPGECGGDRPGRPAVGGGVGAGAGLVPAAGRYAAAAGDVAGDRDAPRLHRGPAQGRGDGCRRSTSGCAMSTAWRASVASLRRYVAANLPEEVRRSPGAGAGRDPSQPGSRRRSTTGSWAGGSTRSTGQRRTVWAFVMVLCCSRHMFVRPDADDGPAGVDRVPRRGVRVLRRCARPARPGKCSAEHFPASVPGRVMWPVTAASSDRGISFPPPAT